MNREENYISLSWKAPQEKVYTYQVFRAKGDAKLILYKTLEPSELQLIDKQLSIGTKYTYSIKYVNQDGIHSLPARTQTIY